MGEFFSSSDIDCEDYLTCDSNIMTSEILTQSDLIESESEKAIQVLKTVKVFF